MSPTFSALGKRMRIRVLQPLPGGGGGNGGGSTGGNGGGQPANPKVSWALEASSHAEDSGVISMVLELDGPAPVGAQVPFIVTAGAFASGYRLIRGVDFEIVTDAGGLTPIPVDIITFPVEATSARMWIKLEDDALTENLESCIIRLVRENGDGERNSLRFGDRRSHTLSVLASDGVPEVGFEAATATVDEGDRDVTYTTNVVLSHPAPIGGVTVDVQVVGGSAGSGTDYTLDTTSLTFAQGVDSQPVTVTVIGNDTYQGDRDLILELHNVAAATIGTGLQHALTIYDDEDPPPPSQEVNFNVDDANGFSITEGGDNYNVRIELAGGQVAIDPIDVTWSVVGTNTNPATLGIDYFAAHGNPVTIPAGQSGTRLGFGAAADGDVEGIMTFSATIASVSGIATIGVNNVARGSIIDSTSDEHEATWNQATSSVVEGSQGVTLLVELDSPTDEGLSIPILVSGTATAADYEITWPGGVDNRAFFPVGTQSQPVTIRALADSVADDDETVVLTLQPGIGFSLGSIPALTVTIQEPQTGGTLVEYEPIQGQALTLVQACIPIDPVAASSLPSFTMDGRQCDVLPVAQGYADGLTRWVQLVGLADGNGQANIEIGAGQSYGGAYDTVDLSGVEITAIIANRDTSTYRAKYSDSTLVEVMDDGILKRTEWRFVRFEDADEVDPALKHVLGLHMLVTRRADGCVEIWYVIANDVYDPDLDPLNATAHDEVDGTVYAQQFTIANGVPGYSHHALVDDPSMDTAQGELMKFGPTSGNTRESHVLPTGVTIAHHYLIKPTSMSAGTADDIARGHGHGYAASGAYNVHARDGFGSQCARVPDMDKDEYTFNSGGTTYTGRAAAKKRNAEYLADVLNHVQTGSGNVGSTDNWPGQQGGPTSYWNPAGRATPQSGNGVEVIKRHGFDFVREQLTWMRLQMVHKLQRQPTGLTHPTRGDNVRVGEIAAANGGDYPWGVNCFNKYYLRFPYKLTPGWGTFPSVHLAPGIGGAYSRPWNEAQLYQGTPVPYVEHPSIEFFGPDLDGGGSTSDTSYPEADHDHYIRHYYESVALAWAWNEPLARWSLRREAAHVERQMCPLPISGGVVDGFQRDNYSTYHMLQNLTDGSVHGVAARWGGTSRWSGWHAQLQRGWGHYADVHAYGSALTPPSAVTERTAQQFWSDSLEALVDYVATDWGGCSRDSLLYPDGHARNPHANNFPMQAANWVTPIPSTGTAWQTYMQAYLGLGALGQAFTNKGLAAAPGFKRTVVDMALAVWRDETAGGMRKDGQPRPPAYVITTVGSNGLLDAPASVPVAWRFVATGPYDSDLDKRSAPLLACGIRWAVEIGDTAARDELLTFAALVAGIPMGSPLEDVESSLLTAMGGNDNEDYRPHGGGYADLLGQVQAAMVDTGGGAFPPLFDASNTGYTGRLTDHVGSLTLSTPGQTYTDLRFTGQINIRAANITIRNCLVEAVGYAYGIENVDFLGGGAHTGLLVEDTEIMGATSSNVLATYGTFRRVNVHDAGADGFKIKGTPQGNEVLVEDSYVHSLGYMPYAANPDDIHADGNQTRRDSGGGITFRRVNFDLYGSVPDYAQANACSIVQTAEADGISGPIRFEECYLGGGNYVLYFTDKGQGYGVVEDWAVTDCIFRTGHWAVGPIIYDGSGGVITGNRRHDTGENIDNELIAQIGWS